MPYWNRSDTKTRVVPKVPVRTVPETLPWPETYPDPDILCPAQKTYPMRPDVPF